MENNTLSLVEKAYGIEIIPELYGNGHINKTYVTKSRPRLIVQEINTSIFKDPVGMMQNIVGVTRHLGTKLRADGKDPDRYTLTVVPALDGEMYKTFDGKFYRAYLFIEDSQCFDMVTPDTLRLAGLDWEDIDFKTKTMHIRKSRYLVNRKLITKCPKTETSIRSLAIPQLLVDKLLEYKEWYDKVKEALGDLWQKNTALLVNDEGNIIYPNLYRIWLRKILKKANLNKVVTVHSLRHTNITLMLTSGVDLRTVSARAGHARTSTTTDIYSHFIKNCDERASRIIDDIFTDKKE